MRSVRRTSWLAGALLCALLAGCAGGGQGNETPAASPSAGTPALADGVYSAAFDTDSSMFHVSEACDGRGVLTVEDGQMTLHVSLASKNIVNLYPRSEERRVGK